MARSALKVTLIFEGRKAMEEDKSSGTSSRNAMKEIKVLMITFNKQVKKARASYFPT